MELETTIKQHQKNIGIPKLRKLFCERKKDNLFREIGIMASRTGELLKMSDTQAIWRGFEYLVNSPMKDRK